MNRIAIAEEPKLGTISRKVYHSCVLPTIEATNTHTYTKGHWWWKKEHSYNTYPSESFDFTCTCGSKWRYRGSMYSNTNWYCSDRKYKTVTEKV